MNCEQVKSHLVDYLYGELPSDQAREIEDALDRCPDCAAELAEMREVHEGVAAMPRLDVPAQVHNNILRQARLAADVYAAEKKRTGINWAALFSPPALATALVMAMVVGVGVMIGDRGSRNQAERGPATVATESSPIAEAPPESVVAAATDEEVREETATGRSAAGRFDDNDDGVAAFAPPAGASERLPARSGQPTEQASASPQRPDRGGADEPAATPTTPVEPEPLAMARLQEEERSRSSRNRESARAERRARDRTGQRDRSTRSRSTSGPEPSSDRLADLEAEDAMAQTEAARPQQEAPQDWRDDYDSATEIAEAETAPPIVLAEASRDDDGRAAGEMIETRSSEPSEWTGEQSITLLGAGSAADLPPAGATAGDVQIAADPAPAVAAPPPLAGAVGSEPADGTEALAYGLGEGAGGLDTGLEGGELELDSTGDALATVSLDELYSEGLSRYNDGSYRDAIVYFDLLIQNAPRTSDFYDLSNYYQGQANISMGNYREAAGNFEQIDDPGFEHFEEARLLLAQAYENSGEIERAEGLYNELLRSSNVETNALADEGIERINRRRQTGSGGARPSRSMRANEDRYDEAEEAEPAAEPAAVDAEKPQSR